MSQVIKKRKIVIASVLKPVDDTRMFEKIGQSLADSGRYDVHIIGFHTAELPNYTGIRLHPLFHFGRLNIKRILAPWMVLKRMLQIRPHVFIIATHELLIIACLAKLFLRCKVVYDIQENYYRNIRHLRSFPSLARLPLALYVRAKEKIITPLLDHVILSDEGYHHELKFIGTKYTVVENKARKKYFTTTRRPREGQVKLLFSGTLARSTGVFEAIDLARQLHDRDDTITLTLAGYCAQPDQLHEINQAVEQYSYINLLGGNQLLPHPKIVEAIYEADFGLILYPPNLSTTNRVPTKLYEYLAAKLPIIIVNHQPWLMKCEEYKAAIAIDPWTVESKALLTKIKSSSFYSKYPGNEVFWESEAEKLVQVVDHL